MALPLPVGMASTAAAAAVVVVVVMVEGTDVDRMESVFISTMHHGILYNITI